MKKTASIVLIALFIVNISLAEDKVLSTQESAVKAQQQPQAPVEQPKAQAQSQSDAVQKPVVEEVKPAVPAQEEQAIIDPGNVTVNFKGADVRTVLAYISEVSGVDIVAAPDVKGIIDLKLTNKPWKVALDIITRNYGFAYEREGDIIRVVTLDKLKQEEVVTQTFALNYGKAKDVVAAIKKIVGSKGKVKYDDRTNIIVVTDIPTNVYKIGEIIQKLDKETDQVLIEARVIETVLGDDEKLGIDWNIKFEVSGAKRPITAPFNYFGAGTGLKWLDQYSPLVQTGNTATAVTAGGTTTTTTPAAYPGGPGSLTPPPATGYAKGFPFVDYSQDLFKDTFRFGTLDFSQFQAVLELLKQRSDTEVVSNPRIATLDNTEANILVGQTLNMPKYERNAITGKMEITGYEAKDLGVKLKVTPHINENGQIVVDVIPEISDLVKYDTIDAANGIVAPVFASRQANTKVMIRNNDTIFIGGLIKENVVDVKKPIPFLGDMLGDVPFIGLLVCKKEKTKQKTELIFFVTVRLIKRGVDLPDVPLASRTYVPNYNLTQEEWQKTVKKRRVN
ncbi:MAG: secretin N-terminal domain-containing protein [Candidatus Omnitrophota bacterium]|nr:secretin N-terminal domain-containing protein [Candidatus Omnitrophota bacterium]